MTPFLELFHAAFCISINKIDNKYYKMTWQIWIRLVTDAILSVNGYSSRQICRVYFRDRKHVRTAVPLGTHNKILDIDSARPLKTGIACGNESNFHFMDVDMADMSVVLLRPWIIHRDNVPRLAATFEILSIRQLYINLHVYFII